MASEVPNLSGARIAIESLMIDAVTITVESEPTDTIDEATGTVVQTDPVQVYSGKAKVKRNRAPPTDQKEGGAQTYVTRVTVGLPHTAPDIEVGSIVEVTSSVRDTTLPGRKYVVKEVPGSTFAIQRTLECEEAEIVQQARPQ